MNMEQLGNESKELTPEEIKELDEQINLLLERLNEFDFSTMPPKIQEEWYWVETEAGVGKDRRAVKDKLEKFIEKLKQGGAPN